MGDIKMFKHIKLTTKSSNWKASINPKLEDDEIIKHFKDKFFDVSNEIEIEKMEKVEKVEFLYTANFTGKTLGAIGEKQKFKNVHVYGEHIEAANLNLYDNYEHISDLKIIQNLD